LQLTLITYLAPSLPAELFRLIADEIRAATGIPTHLLFETRISGPLEGDEEPFSGGVADLGFVCSPSFRWMRERNLVSLLPVAVPSDPRAEGRPVYFSEVIVAADSPARSVSDLACAEWTCNDSHSLSGYLAIMERLTRIEGADPRIRFSGSHLNSMEQVVAGAAEAAAIDSNVLLREMRRRPELARRLRRIDSWGPRPMQPTIARASLAPELRSAIARALLEIRGTACEELGFRGFASVDESVYGVNVPGAAIVHSL
jgi:phosphonate transport system substrate-binding protein